MSDAQSIANQWFYEEKGERKGGASEQEMIELIRSVASAMVAQCGHMALPSGRSWKTPRCGNTCSTPRHRWLAAR
ncbi:hypothetical protein [Pseudomonas aeruginosa]|uniref:hypothetical protein n=1 Tax=Pseudomonas aeruginosa TaxID=287 RepID=UPI000B2AB008|nr:hypothetical protein [Pseudomonas aeruginosa]